MPGLSSTSAEIVCQISEIHDRIVARTSDMREMFLVTHALIVQSREVLKEADRVLSEERGPSSPLPAPLPPASPIA